MTNTLEAPESCSSLLPDTMAGLLHAAIIDARSLDRTIYNPYFDEWHGDFDLHRCEICLAGSLIAGTLNATPGVRISPNAYPRDINAKLEALDYMRSGMWSDAFRLVYGRKPDSRIESMLRAIASPSNASFCGWDEFDDHLASLEELLLDLRRIDAQVAKR